MKIENGIYIKLGESGIWERDSIDNNKIRFGWKNIPLFLINNHEWNQIKELVDKDFQERGKKNGSTNDYNALYNICTSSDETIFITFNSGKMYWCTGNTSEVFEDDISKYIKTNHSWTCKNISGTRTFEINRISGRLTKYQLFMGTVCKINNKLNELDYLITIIEGNESKEYLDLLTARNNLRIALVPAIQNMIPKDFEILIDLIFRNSGWNRTSVLGEVMKFFDLVLEEPFTKKLHGVQIKSRTNLSEFNKYQNEFIKNYSTKFESFFFVVHTPDVKIVNYRIEDEKIKLLLSNEIADLAIDSGLVSWIMDKSK